MPTKKTKPKTLAEALSPLEGINKYVQLIDNLEDIPLAEAYIKRRRSELWRAAQNVLLERRRVERRKEREAERLAEAEADALGRGYEKVRRA